jgi:hypothetical protein
VSGVLVVPSFLEAGRRTPGARRRKQGWTPPHSAICPHGAEYGHVNKPKAAGLFLSILVLSSAAALAQDEVNFRCDFPTGPRSLEIWASNPTADAKTRTVVCTARSPAEPEFNFTVICTNAPVRALGVEAAADVGRRS